MHGIVRVMLCGLGPDADLSLPKPDNASGRRKVDTILTPFALLQPQWPWCLKEIHKGPPFFPSDEVLSLVVAAVMGLQHALAMVGGIVTPPLIIGYLQDDPKVANCE